MASIASSKVTMTMILSQPKAGPWKRDAEKTKGTDFLGWIKTFYKNISSCVINNGFSTPFFNLKRGVCQGDPLSPSLFIIVLELLAVSIRNNDQIKGIAVDGSDIKLVIFADDMTSFVRDKFSHHTLLDTID